MSGHTVIEVSMWVPTTITQEPSLEAPLGAGGICDGLSLRPGFEGAAHYDTAVALTDDFGLRATCKGDDSDKGKTFHVTTEQTR